MSEGQNIQVVKDMPCHVSPALFESILAQLPDAKHVFLVRHPYRTIPSYWPFVEAEPEVFTRDVVLADITYKPMCDFTDILTERLGAAALLVLDADDFIRCAETPLRRLCDHIEVPFTSSLLHWTANEVPSSWRDLDAFEGWLDNVVASAGWIPKPNLELELKYPECKDFQRECIDVNMPFYLRLRQLS